MSPERPGRWVTLRQGAGKSWQISYAGGASRQAFGARFGALSPILRCLLTGLLGSRGGLRGTLAGLIMGSPGYSSGNLLVSLSRLPGCPGAHSLRCSLGRGGSEALMPAGAPDSGYWSLRAGVVGLSLGSVPSGNDEESGLAALAVLRECVFGEGAGRACLFDT